MRRTSPRDPLAPPAPPAPLRAARRTRPTGREVHFGEEEIIVTKTDLTGHITYANDVFCRVAGYTEAEALGQPHSLIRHPDMPRAVFQLLWDTIRGGREVFAYVVNLARTGDHYWVFAHVTPTFGAGAAIVGYHSNRRCPDRDAIERVRPLYAEMLAAEQACPTKADGIAAGLAIVERELARRGCSYEQLVFAL